MPNGHSIHPLLMLPFGLLLGLIALAPIFFPGWWMKHYPKVALGLGALVVGYYLIQLHAFHSVGHTASEYLSFIILIGSLYIVSGGIHIRVKGEATPLANIAFLLAGALAANVLGTTGASMLLIRPWLRMNKFRLTGFHVVFFIFIVSNVGGCLTPIGDPPLFLGYLMGVPFWWVARHCFPMWALAVGILLAMFFVLDTLNFRRTPKLVREELAEPADHWRFEGLSNLFFLAMILGAFFVNRPLFLREAIMALAALGSFFTTRKSTHAANHFNLHPIQEVAILFVGIFATMMPALEWLESNSSHLQSPSSGFFFWGTGVLSSLLDNAPTYVCFMKAVFGRFLDQDTVSQVVNLIETHGVNLGAVTSSHAMEIQNTFSALQLYHPSEVASGMVTTDQIEMAFFLGNLKLNAFITAISTGAVFFGACTYIGNGPNFMVKSIADQQNAHAPDFLQYIFKYTLPFMVPMLVIIYWVFFRG
jgi:Na+/H+ antiporter NhaD/arsenite permease-like protein